MHLHTIQSKIHLIRGEKAMLDMIWQDFIMLKQNV